MLNMGGKWEIKPQEPSDCEAGNAQTSFTDMNNPVRKSEKDIDK
jgi:hypothetical protein